MKQLWVVVVGLLCSWPIGSAGAQAERIVVWLDDAAAVVAGRELGGAGEQRERALRVELRARDLLLLEGSAPAAVIEANAVAVMWLESDDEHKVTWLCVRRRGSAAIDKTPLPHPPDAIDPQLLAVAAASLLDRALSTPRPLPVPRLKSVEHGRRVPAGPRAR